jgi:hypothetical protein
LSKVTASYYSVEGEDDTAKPRRGSTNKTTMPKLMFLAAVARPRHDTSRNQMFDGKVGMWPLAQQVPAKRKSINRPKGTLEWKQIKKIDKSIYEEFLFEHIVPAILAKWPRVNRKVWIQQDNAPAHISMERFQSLWEEEKEELHQMYSPDYSFDIGLYCQPPNSPDLNVLDLGVFAALQSMQWKEEAKNINEMVKRVSQIFEEWPCNKLNHVFLTLQTCMNQVIECLGNNTYKIEHMNKPRLERLEVLPRTIEVTDDADRFADEDNEYEDDE